MHPEVVRPGPGSCPICGMALEPRIPHASESDDGELRAMQRRFLVAAVLSAPLFALGMGDMLFGHAVSCADFSARSLVRRARAGDTGVRLGSLAVLRARRFVG